MIDSRTSAELRPGDEQRRQAFLRELGTLVERLAIFPGRPAWMRGDLAGVLIDNESQPGDEGFSIALTIFATTPGVSELVGGVQLTLVGRSIERPELVALRRGSTSVGGGLVERGLPEGIYHVRLSAGVLAREIEMVPSARPRSGVLRERSGTSCWHVSDDASLRCALSRTPDGELQLEAAVERDPGEGLAVAYAIVDRDDQIVARVQRHGQPSALAGAVRITAGHRCDGIRLGKKRLLGGSRLALWAFVLPAMHVGTWCTGGSSPRTLGRLFSVSPTVGPKLVRPASPPAPASRLTGRRGRELLTSREALVRVALATCFGHDGRPTFRAADKLASELRLPANVIAHLQDECFRQGVLVPRIALPSEVVDVYRLEREVKARYEQFGLRNVMLVPGLPDVLEDLERDRRCILRGTVLQLMTDRLVDYLDEIVLGAVRRRHSALRAKKQPRPFRLGLAWGRTLSLLAERLSQTPRPCHLRNLEALPIIGLTGTDNVHPVEANVVAWNVAKAYGGLSAQLPASAYVRCKSQRDAILATEHVRAMLQRIRQCDVVITSMGPVLPPDSSVADDDSEMTLSSDPALNAELVRLARRSGAIGEICYRLFDKSGKAIKNVLEPIGIDHDTLRAAARHPRRKVILVSGGDKQRFEPLKAALRGGFASDLISDTVTARILVGEA